MFTGRELRLPADLVVLSTTSGLLSTEFAWQAKSFNQRAHEFARQHLSRARRHQEKDYDEGEKGSAVQPGEQVYLHTPVPPTGVPEKLHKTWSKPFTVSEILSDSNCHIVLSNAINVQPMTVQFTSSNELGVTSSQLTSVLLTMFSGISMFTLANLLDDENQNLCVTS
ncbi:hypothetical protein FGIG_07003 [Fasciola gigantica]|uniref:Uncharacterized protein n=1 Tax=Fasciola gigantica TaxID=46835 RepID=A0A504YY62_FASGI|nr:hypothetical protein FGIG_07003 [Fasciola gigantica]